VEARFNLAQIYLQHGAKAEAAEELDRALQVNPQFSPARSLRDQLGDSAPQNLQARR
jgi:Tfp pilus assembly protein PilF